MQDAGCRIRDLAGVGRAPGRRKPERKKWLDRAVIRRAGVGPCPRTGLHPASCILHLPTAGRSRAHIN